MADPRTAEITVTVSGGTADRHRLPLGDLQTLAQSLQGALRNVGAVLVGRATGSGGRKHRSIEAATELVLIAPPRPGSLVLELEVGAGDELLLEEAPLGVRAAQVLIAGLQTLDPEADHLPEGFDRGVVKALDGLGVLFRKGLEEVDLGLVGPDTPSATVRITSDRLAILDRLRDRGVDGPVRLEGVLKAVDLGPDPLQCRIDVPFGPGIPVRISKEHQTLVVAMLDRIVLVSGVGHFESGRDMPTRVDVDLLERSASDAAFDRDAWREHRPWQAFAIEQGASPFQLDDAPALFDDENEVNDFIAAARGSGTT